MFEKEAIRHAFEATIGVECLVKPVEDFTYEELSDEQQEKAYDFQKGAEFGYNKCKEEMQRNGLALQSDMDKTIEQNVALKKQIEKMKCCENCKYNSYWGNELHCNYGLKEALNEDRLVECKEMDKWEIKENAIRI